MNIKSVAIHAGITMLVMYVAFQLPVVGPMLRTEAQKSPTA